MFKFGVLSAAGFGLRYLVWDSAWFLFFGVCLFWVFWLFLLLFGGFRCFCVLICGAAYLFGYFGFGCFWVYCFDFVVFKCLFVLIVKFWFSCDVRGFDGFRVWI